MGKGYQGSGYSWIPLFESMGEGGIKGMLVWGMNPAVSSPNLSQAYDALAKLEWLAAFDLFETDTSVFWKRPGAKTKDIKTEVFLFPVADSMEKEGSVSNSGRWIQWRYQAVKAHGDAKSDLWYANRLGLELKKLYQADPKAVCPDPIVKLNWNYGDDPDVHLVAKEINGYTVADKKQLANFLGLKDDGSTAGGCWIYSGYYPGPDKKDNKAAARDKKDPTGLGLYPGWAFAWPVNRRIIYNRCSLDPQGQPWNKAKALFAWDPAAKTWKNFDVPDFKWIDPATKIHVGPEESAKAPVHHAARRQEPDLRARRGLQGRALAGALRGPGVSLREPRVAPAVQPGDEGVEIGVGPGGPGLRSQVPHHRHHLPGDGTLAGRGHDPESHLAGRDDARDVRGDQPVLAKAKGIKPGDWVKVKSVRGEVMARADVTHRVAPFTCGKPPMQNTVEMVALPWHFGFAGLITGGPDARAELRRQPAGPHGGGRQHHDPGIQGIPGGCAKGLRGREGDCHE